jgi:hypothetical protein
VTHPSNFTPLAKLAITRLETDVPSHHAAELISRHFTVGVPVRADDVIKAIGASAFIDATRRGLLRVETVDGDVDLVHVV